MMFRDRFRSCRAGDSRGFTAMELIVVIAMVGILGVIAAPSIMQWRNSMDSSRVARKAYDALREARSNAVASRYQHMVQFDQPNSRFQSLKGTRSYNTPNGEWSGIGEGWATADSVQMKSGADCSSSATVSVKFNADGTATVETPSGTVAGTGTATVCLQGGANQRQSKIQISSSGRVTLQ